jgi:arabinose-5-phosphate isomerase
MKPADIISSARRTLQIQAGSVNDLQSFINDDFVKAVELVANCNGRLVVSGIGKSAIIAQKIVATLNSTGTAALFMHAADAIHGDLGMIQGEDVVMLISKSGDSPEIKVLVPLLKNFGNQLIGMVGNTQSYLAGHCDIMINSSVEQEACPNNLAPTSSSTAQMVMGDALAVCLMEWKGFRSDDFARFHPGGALGKKLYLRVSDLVGKNMRPRVTPDTPVKEVIVEITRNRLGTAAVLNEQEQILGIVTDGDIRRMLEKYNNFSDLKAGDIMGKNPRSINADAMAVEALETMRKNNISQLLVIDNNRYAGVVHLHDLVREGII